MLKSAGFEESPRINKYLALTCSVKVNLTCLTILPFLLGKLVQNKLLPWSLSFPIHSSDSSCKTRGLPLTTLILNSCGFTWKKKIGFWSRFQSQPWSLGPEGLNPAEALLQLGLSGRLPPAKVLKSTNRSPSRTARGRQKDQEIHVCPPTKIEALS